MGERPYIPVVHSATLGRPDEADTLVAAEAVTEALEALGYDAEPVYIGLDLRRLERLARKRPLVVFNLVEALALDVAAANVVPALLDRLKLGYTGSGFDALVAAQSKLRMKQVLACAGLPTPAWSETGTDLPDGALVMVKSVDEHASVGIDRHSVVRATEAAAEIARREGVFGGRFFAEAFLDGREFNISLLEGPDGVEVLPIPEIEFVDFAADRPRIVDYGAKWIEEDPAYHNTPRRFGVEAREPEVAMRLREVVLAVWRAFGLRGYARVDLRADGAGNVYVIDVNTNPCIAPDAGLAAAAIEAGIGYDGLVQRIVAAAVAYRIARHGALPAAPRRRGSRIGPVRPELRVAGLTARA